jgi:hypothetical protein
MKRRDSLARGGAEGAERLRPAISARGDAEDAET